MPAIDQLHCAFSCGIPTIASVWNFEGRRSFWVYGDPDRNFGAPYMVFGDIRPTDSDSATSGIHFFPHPVTGMDSVSADAIFSGHMMCHHLFDGAYPYH